MSNYTLDHHPSTHDCDYRTPHALARRTLYRSLAPPTPPPPLASQRALTTSYDTTRHDTQCRHRSPAPGTTPSPHTGTRAPWTKRRKSPALRLPRPHQAAPRAPPRPSRRRSRTLACGGGAARARAARRRWWAVALAQVRAWARAPSRAARRRRGRATRRRACRRARGRRCVCVCCPFCYARGRRVLMFWC